MDNEMQEPELLSGGEVLFEYSGPIYNRPCGRGICLGDEDPERYLEYVIDGGNYYLEVVVRKLPASYQPKP